MKKIILLIGCVLLIGCQKSDDNKIDAENPSKYETISKNIDYEVKCDEFDNCNWKITAGGTIIDEGNTEYRIPNIYRENGLIVFRQGAGTYAFTQTFYDIYEERKSVAYLTPLAFGNKYIALYDKEASIENNVVIVIKEIFSEKEVGRVEVEMRRSTAIIVDDIDHIAIVESLKAGRHLVISYYDVNGDLKVENFYF